MEMALLKMRLKNIKMEPRSSFHLMKIKMILKSRRRRMVFRLNVVTVSTSPILMTRMTWRNLLLTKEKDQLHLGENLVEEKGGEEKNGREKERNVNAKKEGKDFRKKRRKWRTFLDKKKERKHPKIRTDLVDQIVVMAVADSL